MKKLAVLASSLVSLLAPVFTFAQGPSSIPIQINPPVQGVNPFTSIGTLLSNALVIVFIVGAIIVLVMLVIGAVQWILSGGDKDAVANARKRITNALIGLAILALAFLIVQVVGQILNIPILDLKQLPTLGQPSCGPGNVFDPTKPGCVPAPKGP